jgi:hypothetical protein
MKAHEALIAWNRGDDVEGDGYKPGDICVGHPTEAASRPPLAGAKGVLVRRGGMTMDILRRTVLRTDHPEAQQGMTPQHRVRPLMPAAMRGDWEAVDPFLAGIDLEETDIAVDRAVAQCEAGLIEAVQTPA